MGFLFRAAIVVGVIYAVSPLRDPTEPALPRRAREGLARGAAGLAGAAMTYCKQDPSSCLAAAAQANGDIPSERPSMASVPAAPAKPVGPTSAPAPRKISLTPEPRDKPRLVP